MDHDVDPVQGHVEQQVGLDHLEGLVHEGGGVGGDDAAHVPRGVCEGLGGRDGVQGGAVQAAERPARGREHEAADLVRRAPAQRLRERGVLGVHRHELARAGGRLHEGPADDERLLVGQGQAVAGVQRGEGGPQADRARDPVEHGVGAGPHGDLLGGARTGEQHGSGGRAPETGGGVGEGGPQLLLPRRGGAHRLDLEAHGLLGQQGRVRPARERDGPEPGGVLGDHVEALGADRARGADQGDGARGAVVVRRGGGGQRVVGEGSVRHPAMMPVGPGHGRGAGRTDTAPRRPAPPTPVGPGQPRISAAPASRRRCR
ncbi:Uncharacterised protein [Streptococcus pneumoniae]|nr:Uncharacterised protein [Streptococcus pneumoniae]